MQAPLRPCEDLFTFCRGGFASHQRADAPVKTGDARARHTCSNSDQLAGPSQRLNFIEEEKRG